MPSWTCRSRRSSRAGERRFQSSKESLASAQGPARGWRVCSFIGVGYLGLFGLWLMEGFCSVQECLLRRGGKGRAEQGKLLEESFFLFPKKGGRRRRVKRPRKSATWLRLYTSAIPQSSWQGGRPPTHVGQGWSHPTSQQLSPTW